MRDGKSTDDLIWVSSVEQEETNFSYLMIFFGKILQGGI